MNRIDAISDANPAQINAVLEANLRPVIRWSSPAIATSRAAGSVVTASHDLGVVPSEISVVPWIDSRVWADENDRRMWSTSMIVFHASATGRYTVKAGVL